MQHHIQPFAADIERGLAATAVSLVMIHTSCPPCNYLLLHSAFRHPLIFPHNAPLAADAATAAIFPAMWHASLQLINNHSFQMPGQSSLYSRWLRPEPTQPSDRDQAFTWSQVTAAYSRRSDHDQMLIEASPSAVWCFWTVVFGIAACTILGAVRPVTLQRELHNHCTSLVDWWWVSCLTLNLNLTLSI